LLLEDCDLFVEKKLSFLTPPLASPPLSPKKMIKPVCDTEKVNGCATICIVLALKLKKVNVTTFL